MPLGANKAAIMGVAGVSTADVVLLSTQTADSDSAVTFSSGITSTYGEYIFKFYNLNPETDSTVFSFQCNGASESGYNENINSTSIRFYQFENDGNNDLDNDTGADQANGTGDQQLAENTGNGADESCSGEMHLFNPASTTYAKHWYSRFNALQDEDRCYAHMMSGYINTTTAIDDVKFKFSSGDFEGKIKMWGVK